MSFCHRFLRLYWNHSSCRGLCSVADEVHGQCQTCRHRDGERCVLTNTSLPEAGGCCHWNVSLIEEMVRVTPVMVAPLAGFFDLVRHILADLPHQVTDDAWIIPAGYARRLTELGIDYQQEDDGLYVNPEARALVVDEPVTDILDWLDVPYQCQGTPQVDLAELSLPLVYGESQDY